MFNLFFYCSAILGLVGIKFFSWVFICLLVIDVALNICSFAGTFFMPGIVKQSLGSIPSIHLLSLLPKIGLFFLLVGGGERAAAIAVSFIILNNINIFYESNKA